LGNSFGLEFRRMRDSWDTTDGFAEAMPPAVDGFAALRSFKSKIIQFAKVSITESVKEPEGSNPIESLWHFGNTNDRHRLIEIKLSDMHADQVDRKRTAISAAKLHVPHKDSTAMRAVTFLQDHLENRLSSAGARIGYETSNKILCPAR